jgi:hypothetical protein
MTERSVFSAVFSPTLLATLVACVAHAQTVTPPAARGAIRLGSDDPNSVLYEEETEASTEGEAVATDAVTVQPGDAHLVAGGETLWSLAQRFLGDADLWPKLWSYNPHITNPHYIYPGETIYLGPTGAPIVIAAEEPADEPVAEAPAPITFGDDDTPTLRTASRLPADLMFLRQHGFLEEADLREAGRIVGSKEEKLMLATLDEAYVQLPSRGDPKAVEVGGRYAAYRMVREIVHPKTEERLGYLVEVLGTVEVASIDQRRLAKVTVVDAENPIERETTRIGPLRRRFHQIQPRANGTDVEGTLAGSLREAELIGTDAIVMLDRGERHGVRSGNRFHIVESRDGLTTDEDVNAEYPPEAVGEILVLEARRDASVGYVTRLMREGRIGDRVRMRKGY